MPLHLASRRSVLRTGAAVLVLLCASASAAHAQRADENAVRSADDAFGNSVGSERIGLYSDSDARGFSPVSAGNIRIEGLYIDNPVGFTSRLVAGSTLRVGIAAQGYPFPAPTGLADYALRRVGDSGVVSLNLRAGPFASRAVSLDTSNPSWTDGSGSPEGSPTAGMNRCRTILTSSTRPEACCTGARASGC